MALSYAKYTGTGATTQFPITFPYIDASHIFVSVNGIDVAFTSDVINQVVTLPSAPVLGSDIRVYRFTPRNKTYSDFSRGNALGQRNMNNSFLWQLYISQEIAEGSISPEFVMNQDLNMGGNKVTNMGTATNDSDAVTYKQLNDALVNISAQGVIPIVGGRQIGVAGQSQYNTPATKAATPASFRISIDGLLQRPVTDYTTDTIGKVDFVGAVPVGAEIDVVFFEPNNINMDASNLIVTSTGSSTPRKLSDRFSDTINVKDFGAVGDGIVDDTTAIQTALNTGSDLVLPEGIYLCGKLTMMDNQSITGVGRKSVLKTKSTDIALAHGSYCSISNFSITPHTTDTTFTHPNDGFNDPERNFSYLNNVVGIGSKSSGLKEIKICGMYIEKLWRGIGLGNAKNIIVSGNIIKWIGVWQTQFYNCEALIFDSNICIYGGSNGGVAASSVKRAVFSNNIVIGSGTGINTGGSPDPLYNAEDITVTGNHVWARDCINLENGIENATISGNTVKVFRNHDLVGTTGVGIACSSNSSGGAAGVISYVTIDGNTVRSYNDNVAYGVLVSTTANDYPHTFDSVIITNNNIEGANFGILVNSGTTAVSVRDSIINGNIIKMCTKGIQLSNLLSARVSHNTCVQAGNAPLSGYVGVDIINSTRLLIEENALVGFGNTVKANAGSTFIECIGNDNLPHRVSNTEGAGGVFDNTSYSFWNDDDTMTVTLADSRLYVCAPFIEYQPTTTHTINALLGGYMTVGKTFTIRFNGNTTIQSGTYVALKGNTSTTPANGEMITFIARAKGRAQEISRTY